MKIVFCGPPHSGKSVFVANLVEKLPTDDYNYSQKYYLLYMDHQMFLFHPNREH